MSDPYLEEIERRDYEDYLSYLRSLVDNGDIENVAAVGITRKLIAEGKEALSRKQAYVFEKEVTGKFPQPHCEQCNDLIPWAEAYFHVHERGRCASCEHTYRRFMDES